ncbi:hypothetical protein LSA_2p00360 (plasmid) [Fructilactobacillus sanfranciscensis TMW 1.1304]|uniref:Uncharacterized protein n=1 Tax=Fructilactobacillus sanfranciscensis (strain TMW 1.1304) TaxID=714313 RepID=G2KWU0_FRUST|nr:hypothetical protein LSA_2p00360 [Fructilactobacillus sanfranciscensis TMW 1.1304]
MRGEYSNKCFFKFFNFRITPTCVGNTIGFVGTSFQVVGSPPHAWGILCISQNTMRTVKDHPHMRGEYGKEFFEHEKKIGSPPHAWGILIFEFQIHRHDRITPTCVGNT